MRESRLKLLLLYASYTDRLSYYDDWRDALTTAPHFDAVSINIVSRAAVNGIRHALGNVDAVVLLHSTNGDTTEYLEPLVSVLADRRVPLLSFVGNEVSLPGSPIAAKRELFARLRPEFVATQLLLESGRYLFGDVVSRDVVAIPHALNPSAFRPTLADERRAIDFGARAVRYLPHLGDDDRNRILDLFRIRGPERGLTVDISDSRFNRDDWAVFLNTCKATVSTEAGTWFLERDDATVNAIRAYVLSRTKGGIVIANDSKLRRFGHKLPWWAREFARRIMRAGPVRHESLVNEAVPPQDILTRFFAGRPRPATHGKCISSRHFDAIGTKTCQIMIKGRFNDILEADKHYIAVDEDLSQFDVAIERFRDPTVRRKMADEAYGHIMAGHTYAHRAAQVYQVLATAC